MLIFDPSGTQKTIPTSGAIFAAAAAFEHSSSDGMGISVVACGCVQFMKV